MSQELAKHCMKKLKTILQSKYLFKILCIICIIYSLLLAFYLPINSKYSKDDNVITGKVIQYQIDGNKLKITLKGKEKILIYYYFKTEIEKNKCEQEFELGSTLKITGQLAIPKKNTIPNGFNYKNYLRYHNINYYMYATNIKIIKSNTSVLYFIKNKLVKRIDKIDDTGYLRTFILGDKTLLDEDALEKYQQNGISHLFSISGMHVSLIVGMLMFILDKVSYNNFYKYGVTIPILLFYLFLTGFGASILRTVLMFIVFAVNKCLNLKIKRVDLMLLVLAIAIIIQPFIIYDIGFQFSYSISFTLIAFYKRTSKLKKKWQQSLCTSLICFFISFPVCIYYYSQVNILSIFLNLIMIPIVSAIIFPMSLLTFILPIMYPIYRVLLICLEEISSIASNIKIFELVLSKPSLILVLVYYVLIYLTLWRIGYVLLFILILFFHKNYLYLDNNLIFTVLDVGQGDSIFIKLPNNQGNILIDTGGEASTINEEWKKTKKEFSIAKNNIIPYLKSLGISSLDYLIITHGDYDHMGEAKNIIKNFKVNNVIFNKNEYNTLETELIEILNEQKIKYFKSEKKLTINKYIFYFLNQTIYKNKTENENSNVIYFKFKKYKFLLMGDATEDNEKEILEKYKIKNITFLKIGHHGSKTSSSKEFIDAINPRNSIISVGEGNKYGHPAAEVISNLYNSNIFRTDEMGSVVIKINNNYVIQTYAPY